MALVLLHILIGILAPDPPKVNNEPVNSDHLPSGSRPLTLSDPRVRHTPAIAAAAATTTTTTTTTATTTTTKTVTHDSLMM